MEKHQPGCWLNILRHTIKSIIIKMDSKCLSVVRDWVKMALDKEATKKIMRPDTPQEWALWNSVESH